MQHAPSQEQQDIHRWFTQGYVGREPTRYLSVDAVAGSGKTTTLLWGVDSAPDRSILLTAFNKSIATELQERLKNPAAQAKTLHQLGCKFVFRNWEGVKVDDQGRRADALTRAATKGLRPSEAVSKLISQLHTKGREILPHATTAQELADLASRFGMLPEEAHEGRGWGIAEISAAALRALQLAKQRVLDGVQTTAIDFADMIFLPLTNGWVRPYYNLGVIDEAQDMTAAQLELARKSVYPGGRIAIFGDRRQAIYGFRGADTAAYDQLVADLRAATLPLHTTRRCATAIVAEAKAIVGHFTAAPDAEAGEVLTWESAKMLEEAKPGDFVLSRTNAPLIKVALPLLKRGARARIKGRDIGRGIQALLRKLDPADPSELPNLLQGWVFAETQRALSRLSAEAAAERIDAVEDQAAVLTALAEDARAVDEIRDKVVVLFADDAEHGAIMCSTVHRAKGLEADVVYVLDGTFRKGSEEEDNIRYVAITRARKRLVRVRGFEKARRA